MATRRRKQRKATREADGSPHPGATKAFRAYAAGRRRGVEAEINHLDPLAAAVLRRCWLSEPADPLEDVAADFRVPVGEMRKLEERAFTKLRVWQGQPPPRERTRRVANPYAGRQRTPPDGPGDGDTRNARAALVRLPPRGIVTTLELARGQERVLGCGASADSQVWVPGVRATHATVCWSGGPTVQVHAHQQPSDVPTLVDGQPVHGSDAVTSGAEIRIGPARWIVAVAGMDSANEPVTE